MIQGRTEQSAVDHVLAKDDEGSCRPGGDDYDYLLLTGTDRRRDEFSQVLKITAVRAPQGFFGFRF